jgi:hypothetical protein
MMNKKRRRIVPSPHELVIRSGDEPETDDDYSEARDSPLVSIESFNGNYGDTSKLLQNITIRLVE